MYNDKLVELPDYGGLIVVTDLHGNYNDYMRYLELWDFCDEDCNIVFAGDLIHASNSIDYSVEIMDDAIRKSKMYSNFHDCWVIMNGPI